MAMTSWAENEALATDHQCRLQAEAVRQQRVSEAEQARNAAMRQVRYRDTAMVALVLLFALLSFFQLRRGGQRNATDSVKHRRTGRRRCGRTCRGPRHTHALARPRPAKPSCTY